MNVKNRTLFHGDNLKFLRAIDSKSVHLIATDPPFNKGRDFHAAPDSLASGARFQDRWTWERDVHQEWIDQITDDFPKVMNVIQGSRNSYGDDMAAFLCFMAVRLLEMRRVLRDDGSIYLHCDHTASHYLKNLMDSIFGRKQFRNEIVWHYSGWNKTLKDHMERRHDVLLFYSKSDKWTFNYPTEEWKGKGRRVERSIEDAPDHEVPLDDVWVIPKLNNSDKERYGYPTQKPLALYERIIKVSSNRGDFVLDPFCGCATAPVAAEKTQRQWIGIDIWDKAHDAVITRLNREGLLAKPDADQEDIKRMFGQVHYETDPPERTDGGEEVVPYLRPKVVVQEPKGEKMSRNEMYEYLLDQRGPVCQGCNRRFDDPRYLELDHNTPRSDGGINHISNRILLCGPCNRAKSNTLTLTGLRQLNKKNGWMVGSNQSLAQDRTAGQGLGR